MNAYEAPAITELGSIADFTQVKATGSWDGSWFQSGGGSTPPGPTS
jgi:hypothetical protein